MDMDMELDVDEEFRRWNPENDVTDDEEEEEADEETCLSCIEKALLIDSYYKVVFVGFINELPFDTLERELRRILSLMFMWDSATCAATVFDGQTKLTEMPAWTAWTSRVDNGPLHEAAATGAFKMATLLLQKGFSADARGDYDSLKAVLPLDVVLSKLRYKTRAALKGGNPSSPVKLVRQLCDQSVDMQRTLETLRVIAKNTSDVKGVFFNYLKDGRMVEVAALLLIAGSRVLSSSPATPKGEFQSISEMHDFLLNAKCQVSPTATATLAEMEDTLLLLKIFDKIGDKLAQLFRFDLSIYNVAGRSCSSVVAESLMENAGFDVEPKLTCGEFFKDKFPIRVEEGALRGLGDKSSNTSPIPYSSVPKPPSCTLGTMRSFSSVSASPLSSGSVPLPVNLPLLQHLVTKKAPILRTIRTVSRFR